MTPYALFERCNETELYQIARAAGLNVLPSAPRELLINCIIGEAVPPPVSHEFDEWRLAIMGFVIEHRKRLEVQLRCPAKSMDPRACFQCVDEQVVSCLVDNKSNLNLIQLHKKPIVHNETTGDPMTSTVLNPEIAPRDKEKLKASGGFQLRKLAESLGILGDTEKTLAWGKMSPEEKAETVFSQLQEWDKGHGKSVAAPSTNTTSSPAAASTPTAETPGSTVAAVDAGAFKAAQEATGAGGPGVASTKRQPKAAGTNGTPANGGGESDIAALVGSIQALIEANKGQSGVVVGALGELKTLVSGVSSSVDQKMGNIEKAITTALAQQTALLKITIAIVLTIAEERGVASRFDILADAVGESTNLDAMMAEVKGSAGKAA